MNILWLVLAVSVVYNVSLIAMYEQKRDPEVILLSQVQFFKKNKYDLKELPGVFDEKAHGFILRHEKKPEGDFVNTHLNYLGRFNDESKQWECINSASGQLISHETFMESISHVNSWQLSQYITGKLLDSDFRNYHYSPQSRILMYPRRFFGDECECRSDDWLIPLHSVALITPQRAHYIEAPTGCRVGDIALSKQGNYGAYVWAKKEKNDCYTSSSAGIPVQLSVIDLADLVLDREHMRDQQVDTSCGAQTSTLDVQQDEFPAKHIDLAEVACNGKRVQTNLFFDERNNVHFITRVPEKSSTHMVATYPDYGATRHDCLVDCGQENLLPMAMTSRFPLFYNQLLNSEYTLQLSFKLQAIMAFMDHQVNVEAIPFEVVRHIVSLYRMSALEQVSDGLQFVYGSSCTADEKRAVALLSTVIKEASMKAIRGKDTKWTEDDTWNAVKHAEKWKETCNNSYIKTGANLFWPYLAARTDLDEQKSTYILDDRLSVLTYGEKISIDWYNPVFMREATITIRDSFLEHTSSMMQAHDYKDFIQKCSVKNVTKQDDTTIVIALHGGEQIVARKDDVSEWNRRYS